MLLRQKLAEQRERSRVARQIVEQGLYARFHLRVRPVITRSIAEAVFSRERPLGRPASIVCVPVLRLGAHAQLENGVRRQVPFELTGFAGGGQYRAHPFQWKGL